MECGARFRAPVFADHELEVVSSAENVDARSFRMDHRVERSGEFVASGFEKRVAARVLEHGRLKITPMPSDPREWLVGSGVT